MKRKTLILCLETLFILLQPLALKAADDAYHAALRAQLLQKGISGGTWVFTDSESGTLGLAAPTNVTVNSKTWSGSEPFTQTRELAVPTATTNSWDAAVRFAIRQPLTKGDSLLLVIWVRGISATDGDGYFTHIFEQTSDPYAKSLSLAQTPAKEWQQWMIPFQAGLSLAAGQGRYQMNVGFQAQTIEIAGLAMLNFGTAYTLDQLPKSRYHLDYAGHSPDAFWRVEALARIESLRKARLRVQVVDQRGAPVPGATVHIRMKRHAFGFGTALSMGRMLGTGEDDSKYRDRIFNLNGDGKTWSMIVFENAMKWPTWEGPGEGSKEEVVNTTKALRDAGIRVRGHNLVWPSWQYLPTDVQDNRDPVYVKTRIQDHILEEAGYPGLKGQLAEWDVLNEPAHLTDLKTLFGGEQMYADWFKLAAQADPDAKLYINEYSIISSAGKDTAMQAKYRGVIETILAGGGRIDGIGIQGHVDATPTPPETVYRVLNDFSGYGAAISITEFDAAGADEEIMGDYMRDLLIICFSHPRVENFVMWGFWDGAHWHSDAPIFKRDWTVKPSGQAFLKAVFNDWWTDVSAVSDEQGAAEVRGFLGDYEVDVSYDGQIKTRSLSLGREGVVQTVALDLRVEGAPRRPRGDPWRLVWSDEFEGPAIDLSKWEHQIGNGSGGWGNNEKEYYTERSENSRIEDGKLVIEARNDSYQPPGTGLTFTYTSARMRTRNKGDWTFGRFDFRAKLPRGQGLWPAIWMMPTDDFYGTWAASGEIDIVEYLGHQTNKVYGTLHYGAQWPNNKSSGTSYVLPFGNFADDFHLFRLEWEPGGMRWYVDGVLYQTQPPPQWYTNVPFPAPFDKRFHLIMNLAVGGNWPGSPDTSTQFPQRMEVDYVRVYQRRN